MHLRCSCRVPAMHFPCTRRGAATARLTARPRGCASRTPAMHFSCTSRVPGGRPGPGCSRPVRRPGRGSPVCDASPGTRPARLRPVPADSITVQLATPGHGQPGLAAGQAGHQRGGRMSFPGRPGPRESAAGTSKVHGRYMRHGNARGRAFPGAGLPAAKGWLIPGPAVTRKPVPGKSRCRRVPKKGPETGFRLMSAISPATGRSSPHAGFNSLPGPAGLARPSPAAHRRRRRAPGRSRPQRAAPGCRSASGPPYPVPAAWPQAGTPRRAPVAPACSPGR